MDLEDALNRVRTMPKEELLQIMQQALEDSGIPYPDGVEAAVESIFSGKPQMYNKKNEQWKRRKKCPVCGGEIEVHELYQLSRVHKLTRTGKVSKRYIQTSDNSGEVWMAICVSGCGAYWEDNEMFIDDGYFYECKY